MCAMSSAGDIFFQFLQGNNNSGSVQAFLIGLERYLSKHRPGWRKSHVLLLDNCSSHKTEQTLRVLAYLKMPVIFSAPAYFLAIPIEGLFGALKAIDFSKVPDPDPSVLKLDRIKNFTKKQIVMMKIAEYLFAFSKDSVNSLFKKRFMHMAQFLDSRKV